MALIRRQYSPCTTHHAPPYKVQIFLPLHMHTRPLIAPAKSVTVTFDKLGNEKRRKDLLYAPEITMNQPTFARGIDDPFRYTPKLFPRERE